jgi:PAS domain S-box-containing protein
VIFAMMLAQQTDPLSGGAGWIGAGLLGAVLAWLLWVHLPAKDNRITADSAQAVKEATVAHERAIKEVLKNCQEEMRERQVETRQDREVFSKSFASAMDVLGKIHTSVRESIHATKSLDQAMRLRNHLAEAVQSLDAAAWTKNLEGQLWSWNAACEKLLGWKQGEVVGKSIYQTIIPPERHDEERDVLRQISEGEAVGEYETARLHKNGRRVEVCVLTSPIRDQTGKVIGASTLVKEPH